MSDQQSRTETLSNQVHRQLLAAIRVGEYAGQNRLPSETEMAAHFKVSRPVLRQALERLRRDDHRAAVLRNATIILQSAEGRSKAAPGDNGRSNPRWPRVKHARRRGGVRC